MGQRQNCIIIYIFAKILSQNVAAMIYGAQTDNLNICFQSGINCCMCVFDILRKLL